MSRHHKEESIKNAVAEARRFIERAERIDWDKTYGSGEWIRPDISGKDIAAAKRASMDLTRALAEVRR